MLVRWAVGSWREGNQAAGAEERSRPEPGHPEAHQRGPAPPDAGSADGAARPRPLSADAERELERVVAVLAEAGVFVPRVPRAEQLRGPVADRGGPVATTDVLAALDEAAHYVAGFDATAYSDNLAFHVSHGEQFVDVLHAQVEDIVRLAGGALADLTAAVGLTDRPGAAGVATTIRLTLHDTEQVLVYQGAGKYLSTVVHVALARILKARETRRRLAWVWSDQGVWMSSLPDGSLEALNDASAAAPGERWEWVDEQEPFAAGGGPPR